MAYETYAHDKKCIAEIDNAEIKVVENGDGPGRTVVSFAWFRGNVGMHQGFVAPHNKTHISAEIRVGGEWERDWLLEGFASEKAAMSYAIAALSAELKSAAAKIRADMVARIAQEA